MKLCVMFSEVVGPLYVRKLSDLLAAIPAIRSSSLRFYDRAAHKQYYDLDVDASKIETVNFEGLSPMLTDSERCALAFGSDIWGMLSDAKHRREIELLNDSITTVISKNPPAEVRADNEVVLVVIPDTRPFIL